MIYDLASRPLLGDQNRQIASPDFDCGEVLTALLLARPERLEVVWLEGRQPWQCAVFERRRVCFRGHWFEPAGA